MEILPYVVWVIVIFILGFYVGRDFTKCECGKMLTWLEWNGFLKPPFEENEDEEDS